MTDPSSLRLLVVTADLGGNLEPALVIASRLQNDGASVHVLAHSEQRAAVSVRGLPFTEYTRGTDIRPLARSSSRAALASLIRLVCDRGVGADLVEVAAWERSNVLLVDCMLLGGLRTAARSGIPTVALVHTLPAFFTGKWAHGPIGIAATLRGLRPAKVWRGLAGAVTVCLPELVGAPTALAGPVVGTVLAGRTGTKSSAPTGRPRILVSLSTIWWPGMDAVTERVLEALGTLDVDVVCTTGPAIDPAQLSAPGNVELLRWVDHAQLMPEVDLVIGHGGHGTTMRALAHDLPLLMLPLHPMVDQPMVARVIAGRGAGLTLPRTAPPRAIRDAVHRLLAEPQFRVAAARLGERIRASDGAAVASDYLRKLAAADHVGPLGA